MIGAIIALGIIFALIFGILYWSDRAKIRSAAPRKKEREKRKLRRQTKWTMIAFAFAVVVALLVVSGKLPLPVVGQAARIFRIVFAIILIGVLLLAIYASVKYRKTRQALKLAQKGDVDGAIALIRQAIQERPDSPDLWNTLSILLIQRESYEEALSALERAEALGNAEWVTATNKALVLWKLSRLEEALDANTVECQRNPKNLIAAINQCHILYELGRTDDARKQLAVVDKLDETIKPLNAQDRANRKTALDALYEKIDVA